MKKNNKTETKRVLIIYDKLQRERSLNFYKLAENDESWHEIIGR